MARFTPAYSRFVRRLEEVELLSKFAKSLTIKTPLNKNTTLVNAACRSGVVLLSSHIEGYVEDLGETVIARVAQKQLAKKELAFAFRYHLSRDLISEIRQISDPESSGKKIVDLFNRDQFIWNQDPNFPNNLSGQVFLSDFANPNHDRICKFFRRFGYVQFATDLKIRLGRDFLVCSNMVDQVVDQRNKIAHGDLFAVATPIDVQNMLFFVKQYCNSVDNVVANWFSSKGCPIR